MYICVYIYAYKSASFAGRSLQDVIDDRSRARPWRPPNLLALSWCRQLCAALAFLHDREIPLVPRARLRERERVMEIERLREREKARKKERERVRERLRA